MVSHQRQGRASDGTLNVPLAGKARKASVPPSTGTSAQKLLLSRLATQQEPNTSGILHMTGTAVPLRRAAVSSSQDVQVQNQRNNGGEVAFPSVHVLSRCEEVLKLTPSSAPTTPIWIHPETSLPPHFTPGETSVISAEVKVPSTGSLTAGPVKVHTYKLLMLVLHAMRRLLDAEQVLLSVGNHQAPRNSSQQLQRQVANARKARAQAMLELVLHYDLHLAALRVRDEPVEEETSEEEEARSLRDSRLDRAANLGHLGVEAYYFDSTLFLNLYAFLERHTSPVQVVQDLCSFIQTKCEIVRLHLCHVTEDLACRMLEFLRGRVRTGCLLP
jgi:hypothetical protein